MVLVLLPFFLSHTHEAQKVEEEKGNLSPKVFFTIH